MRLRKAFADGTAMSRRRQLLVFERLLARLVAGFGDAMILKGGLAVEMRLDRCRSTKDVDLRLSGAPGDLLAELRRHARRDLGDFMSFEISPDEKHPEITNDGMKYDGYRYRVECRIAGRPFGGAFGVDVVFGDPIVGESDVVQAEDVLGFAGVAPPTLRLYPVESHLAEKLHAYTMPRERPNSRVKDLPDMALLADAKNIDAACLREAIRATFAYRGTHAPPHALAPPPAVWEAPYARIAKDGSLPWLTLAAVTQAAQAFLDPLLLGLADSVWDSASWSWRPKPTA